MREVKSFADLIGLVVSSVSGGCAGDDEITIEFTDGNKVKMYHSQDCCESVSINDIDGDIQDIVGGVVVEFEEVTSSGDEESEDKPHEYADSFTWTFYKIGTTKGFVNIRWLGESNGYYSEGVSASVFTGNPDHNDWSNGEGWKSIN